MLFVREFKYDHPKLILDFQFPSPPPKKNQKKKPKKKEKIHSVWNSYLYPITTEAAFNRRVKMYNNMLLKKKKNKQTKNKKKQKEKIK